MEFKGTKGKWIIEDSMIKNESKEVVAFTTTLSKRVDDSRLENESWIDMRARIKPELEECATEKQANALLISKAPEMLEILTKLHDHYFNDIINNDFSSFALRSLMDECNKLIKEATEL